MGEREFEYDLAVSFAGQQRDFVRAVVRGLGDDVSVFYDEDQKARLLGENLVDLLTDVYQHRARYVALFISADYADKMWTNLERQSAMARAVGERDPYILPIRMDDTALPGLLPSIGYLDARYEGLNGVVQVLKEKLGHYERSYVGRVPESQADIDLLLALRPDFWEYWLYAGALRVGMARLEGKYRDYELKFAPRSSVAYFDREAFEFLRSAPAHASALADRVSAVLRPEVQLQAFGAPGEPGDPDRIIHMADRLLDVYEGFMDEAARIRGAALPEEFRSAQSAAADFGVQAIEAFRGFVNRCVDEMNELPELSVGQSEDAPLALTMKLTLTVDDDVMRRFTDGLRAGVDSIVRE